MIFLCRRYEGIEHDVVYRECTKVNMQVSLLFMFAYAYSALLPLSQLPPHSYRNRMAKKIETRARIPAAPAKKP